MPNPTPLRQRLRTFLTPDIRDFIVAESKDVSFREIPEYGSAHPDKRKYPNHVFAFAQPADDQGLLYTLLYVMERDEQDAYNWEMQDAGVSDTKFLQVKRSYVTLRSDFVSATPAMGAAMANVPEGKFSGTFVLADRSQRRSSDKELDTLFVVDDRIYIQKEILTDIEPDPQSGIANQVTTTLYYRGESITSGATTQAVQLWFADPTHAYWSTDANGFGRTGKQLTDNWFAVSYGKIVELDTVYEKESNRLRPDKFYCPKDIVSATVITANNTPGEPSAPGAALGQSITVGKIGRILRTKTVTQSGSPEILKSLTLLPDDGYIYPETDQLVAHSEVPLTRSYINSDGKAITFSNYDACNAIKNTRQAVSLEDSWVKSAEKFLPEKFIPNKATKTTEETETGVISEPTAPTGESKKRITVQQKGAVRKTETVEQIGNEIPLPGTDYNSSDGRSYPSTQTVVALAAVPASPPTVTTAGKVTVYTPQDADWAIAEEKQALSIEPETTLAVDRMAPESFFRDKSVTVVQTTESGVIAAVTAPAAADYQSEKVSQKGVIRTRQTSTQTDGPVEKRGTTLDQRTGESFLITQELVKKEAVVLTGVRSDGTVDEFDPLDGNWSVKTQRQLVSTLAKTWTDVINYEWPPVLLGISFKIWAAKNDRGSVVYPIPRWKEGFTGPQVVSVNQYWQLTQPTVIPQPVLVTEGFQYKCPLYSITVPPCLHESQILSCFIGTGDPDWESATDSEVFPATRYTDWPDTIFWRETKPYLGGFLVHEYTLSKPT